MGGFCLDGYCGRIPCPHCGSTDCMMFGDDKLLCNEKRKVVSEAALRRQAEKHQLTKYDIVLCEGWELQVMTRVNQADAGWYKVGQVQLYNDKHGCKGVCPDLATAQEFAKRVKNNFRAHYEYPKTWDLPPEPEEVIPPPPPKLTRADIEAMIKANRELDLHHQDLSEVDLSHLDLYRADLRGANLTNANLTGTNLSCAILCYADLTGAICENTFFSRANTFGMKQ